MKRKRKLLISIYIGSVRLIYFDLDNTSEIIIIPLLQVFIYTTIFKVREKKYLNMRRDVKSHPY